MSYYEFFIVGIYCECHLLYIWPDPIIVAAAITTTNYYNKESKSLGLSRVPLSMVTNLENSPRKREELRESTRRPPKK